MTMFDLQDEKQLYHEDMGNGWNTVVNCKTRFDQARLRELICSSLTDLKSLQKSSGRS